MNYDNSFDKRQSCFKVHFYSNLLNLIIFRYPVVIDEIYTVLGDNYQKFYFKTNSRRSVSHRYKSKKLHSILHLRTCVSDILKHIGISLALIKSFGQNSHKVKIRTHTKKVFVFINGTFSFLFTVEL